MDEKVHRGHSRGEEDGGLTRRVAAADDDDRTAGALLHLGVRGGVVDAGALEAIQARYLEAPVPRAGRHHDSAAGDLAAGREPDDVQVTVGSDAGRLAELVSRAPNFSAWTAARAASSLPDSPAGKPR